MTTLTTSGYEIKVQARKQKITVVIGDCCGGSYSNMSPTEARQLARMLNRAANIAEGK